MNVLYVTQYFSFSPTHASAVTTYEIVRRLAKRGHKVTVLVPSLDLGGARVQPSKNIKVVTLTLSDANHKSLLSYGLTCTVLYAPLIVNALKGSDQDVIISMYHPSHLATFSAYTMSRFWKLPLIVKVHDLLPDVTDPNISSRAYKKAMFRLNSTFLKRASFVLVPSTELINFAVEVYGVSEDKLVLFPNCVDVLKFNPDIRSDHLRRILGLEHRKVLLYVGRISRVRGLEYLIRAMPTIVKEEPDVRLLIIGEGPEKSNLIALSKRLGIDDFVMVMNEVSHNFMPKYIASADVAIGPLTASPLTVGSVPIKVLEYMACEKPIVACRNGVSNDLITNGHNGMLISPENIGELSSMIIRLLEDVELAGHIGRNAREHVISFYDWGVIIERLENLLNDPCQE